MYVSIGFSRSASENSRNSAVTPKGAPPLHHHPGRQIQELRKKRNAAKHGSFLVFLVNMDSNQNWDYAIVCCVEDALPWLYVGFSSINHIKR